MTDWQSTGNFIFNKGAIGTKILHFAETPSTQAPAKKAAMSGEAHGTVFVTDDQTEGRGRRDRAWQSEPGKDLTFSTILRPEIEMRHAPILNFAVAIAVARTLERFAGEGKIKLKWPNDILSCEKKICGMICEISAKDGMLDFAVPGIGINVNRSSDRLPHFEKGFHETTSLLVERSAFTDLPELLGHVLSELNETIPMLENEGGRAALLEEYRKRCGSLGKNIKVVTEDGVFQGVATDIADSGAICIDGGSGIKSFDAGDVIHAGISG